MLGCDLEHNVTGRAGGMKDSPDKGRSYNEVVAPLISFYDVPPVNLLLSNLSHPRSRNGSGRGSPILFDCRAGRRVRRRLRFGRSKRRIIRKTPHLLEQTIHATKTTEISLVAQCDNAFFQHSAERTGRHRKGSRNKQWPDDTAVKTIGTPRNELQHVGHSSNQVEIALLVSVEAGNETTEIDPSSGAEN